MINFFKNNNLLLIIIIFLAIISTGAYSLLSDNKSNIVKESKVETKFISKNDNKDNISIENNNEIRKDEIKKEINKKETDGETFIKKRYDDTETDLKILDRKKFKKKQEDKENKEPFNFDSKISFDNMPKEKEENNISKALAQLNKETAPDMEYIKKNKNKSPFENLKNINKNDNKESISSRYKSRKSYRKRSDEKEEIEQKIALYSSILGNSKAGISKSSGSISFYNIKTDEKNKEDEKNTKPILDKRTFTIIPGSSYYGELKNNIYNLHPNMKAIITISNPEFEDCRFLGSVQETANGGSMAIGVNEIACNDGTIQSVNGIAIRMGDLKPMFRDKINRHLIPKVALITLSSLLNGISLKDTPETHSGTTTIVNGNNKKGLPVNFADAFTPNMALVDGILQEELSYYQTEIEVHPQALVVIFY